MSETLIKIDLLQHVCLEILKNFKTNVVYEPAKTPSIAWLFYFLENKTLWERISGVDVQHVREVFFKCVFGMCE